MPENLHETLPKSPSHSRPDAVTAPLDVASALSQGARTRQEDAFAVAFPEGGDVGFAVLSDGMGGHAAGDLASQVIVSEIFADLTLRCRSRDSLSAGLPRILSHAVQSANQSLRSHAEASADHNGMGGTVIATLVCDRQLYWVSVGDSVLYLWRKGRLTRLNDDHSMAPQLDLLVAKGLMEAEAARLHPQRNCLTSALTGDPIAEIDCPETPLDLLDDDIVILASDGLQFLDEDVIAATVAAHAASGGNGIAAALMMALEALDDPDQDNIALIVIRAQPRCARAAAVPFWQAPAAALRAVGRALGAHRSGQSYGPRT